MKNNENPRLEMLGLNSKFENNLVLYDLLREKNFSQFCNLIKQGYALSAFILNCMIDNGFEDKIDRVLSLCQRHDDNIYEFMVRYRGQEAAERLFIKLDFKNLIKKQFSDDTLAKYQLWDILFEEKKYNVLAALKKYDLLLLETADRKLVADALLVAEEFNLLISLGCKSWLLRLESGWKKLWELKDWESLVYLDDAKFLEASGLSTMDDVWAFIYENGGEDVFYEANCNFQNYLGKHKIAEPFVKRKAWGLLLEYTMYEAIDWDEFYRILPNFVLRAAKKAKNWDFLEKKKCRMVLFMSGHWYRWLRTFKS